MKSITNEFVCVCRELGDRYPLIDDSFFQRLEGLGLELHLNLKTFYELYRPRIPPLSKNSIKLVVNRIVDKIREIEAYDILNLYLDIIFLYIIGRVIRDTI